MYVALNSLVAACAGYYEVASPALIYVATQSGLLDRTRVRWGCMVASFVDFRSERHSRRPSGTLKQPGECSLRVLSLGVR